MKKKEEIKENEENEVFPELTEKKNWVPITLTSGITIIVTLWVLFFYRLLDLQIPLYYSMGFPVVLLFVYCIRKSASRVFYKYVWIVAGASIIGGLMLFGITYILEVVISPPFRDLPGFIRIPLGILKIGLCFGLGGYMGYRWGKKRNYRPYL